MRRSGWAQTLCPEDSHTGFLWFEMTLGDGTTDLPAICRVLSTHVRRVKQEFTIDLALRTANAHGAPRHLQACTAVSLHDTCKAEKQASFRSRNMLIKLHQWLHRSARGNWPASCAASTCLTTASTASCTCSILCVASTTWNRSSCNALNSAATRCCNSTVSYRSPPYPSLQHFASSSLSEQCLLVSIAST
jgi:hypothetical protein